MMREENIQEGSHRLIPKFAFFSTLVEEQWIWWEWYLEQETFRYISDSDTWAWVTDRCPCLPENKSLRMREWENSPEVFGWGFKITP